MQLKTFNIDLENFEGDCNEYAEQVIQLMILNLNQRSSPLTLIFTKTSGIRMKTVIRITQMLENESRLNKNLKIEFPIIDEEEDDLMEVIPEIKQEAHPILHKYISKIAK